MRHVSVSINLVCVVARTGICKGAPCRTYPSVFPDFPEMIHRCTTTTTSSLQAMTVIWALQCDDCVQSRIGRLSVGYACTLHGEVRDMSTDSSGAFGLAPLATPSRTAR
jgi:hypothetical protein